MSGVQRLWPRALHLAGLGVALWSAACGGTTPTSPDTPVSTFTEVFHGTLARRGSAAYAFTVTQEGPLQVTLTSLTVSALLPAGTAVRVGLGQPAGTGCGVTEWLLAEPAFTFQLLRRLTPSIYCVEIRDTGTQTTDVSFSIRITHS